jgi:hypothetical protein
MGLGLIQPLFNAAEPFINAMQQPKDSVLGGLQRVEVQLVFAMMQIALSADRIKAA